MGYINFAPTGVLTFLTALFVLLVVCACLALFVLMSSDIIFENITLPPVHQSEAYKSNLCVLQVFSTLLYCYCSYIWAVIERRRYPNVKESK